VDGLVWLSKDDVRPDQLVYLKVGTPVNFELTLNGHMPRAQKAEVSLLPSRLGRVKRYNVISRCGFITCDDIWEDVWFASPTVVKERTQHINAGTRVRVDLFRTSDWKLRACRVQCVSDEATETSD
jgi:cold shock CspA family protein